MIWNNHWELKDKHADLSPSNYHWINYDLVKMATVYANRQAARRGTELHAFAAEAIRLGIKLPNTSQTLNMYVNDAIGYRMMPEQILAYSSKAFGTADAIGFDDSILRIHDLKNGVSKTSPKQLEAYAALFCLEYKIKPNTIAYDLRIYQNDEVYEFDTDVQDVIFIVEQIKEFDVLLRDMDREAE